MPGALKRNEYLARDLPIIVLISLSVEVVWRARRARRPRASYPRALDVRELRVRRGALVRARAAPLSGAAHQRVVVRAVHRDADRTCGGDCLNVLDSSTGRVSF